MSKNGKTVITIEDIIHRVLSDKTRKEIPYKDFIIVISAYKRIEERLKFKIEPEKPIIVADKPTKGTFYIYDDFYDFEGNKSSAEEVKAHYDKYFHTFMHIPGKHSSFRIDYRPIG